MTESVEMTDDSGRISESARAVNTTPTLTTTALHEQEQVMATVEGTSNAHNFQDLTGLSFGQLEVIRRDPRDKRKIAFWICKCGCGNGCVASAYNLTSGRKTHCGCLRGSRWKAAKRAFHLEHPQPTAHAICLSNGLAVIVDEEDCELVSRYWWSPHKGTSTVYARAVAEGGPVLMHIFLLGQRDGFTIDHINGNGLDNRRENLRYATASQQQQNKHSGRGRSQYKGVSWAKRQRKWAVSISLEGRNKHIGYFDSEDVAAHAYDCAASAHYGEFACLNFPEGVDH